MAQLVSLMVEGSVVSRRKLADGRTEVRVEVPSKPAGQIWIGRASKEK
jgi:hypothetical protein